MSAIPWVGQDIVESNTIIEYCLLLPTIGIVNKNALKQGNKSLTFNKEEFIRIPSSFIAFLTGLIDGDGYIQITKTSKGFIAIKLVISLHLDDIATLQYIHSVLKLGKITIYKDNRSPTCKLIINRTDLQEVLFPLLLYNKVFFLTVTRITQFNIAMFIFKQEVKLFQDIPNPENTPLVFKLPDSPLGYSNLNYFKNWIVGFAMAEGSFFVKSNNDACFSLKQRLHLDLFEALQIIFYTNRKVGTDKELYNSFSVSSKTDVQTVINFFSFSGLHPLVGLKYIQYLKWLDSLANSLRYKELNIPNNKF